MDIDESWRFNNYDDENIDRFYHRKHIDKSEYLFCLISKIEALKHQQFQLWQLQGKFVVLLKKNNCNHEIRKVLIATAPDPYF